MGSGFDHSPSITSGTDIATFAPRGDEKIVTALGASGAGKTIGENRACEIAAELMLDMDWAGSALSAVAGDFAPGGAVRLHGAFGPVTTIDSSASERTGGWMSHLLAWFDMASDAIRGTGERAASWAEAAHKAARG